VEERLSSLSSLVSEKREALEGGGVSNAVSRRKDEKERRGSYLQGRKSDSERRFGGGLEKIRAKASLI